MSLQLSCNVIDQREDSMPIVSPWILQKRKLLQGNMNDMSDVLKTEIDT